MVAIQITAKFPQAVQLAAAVSQVFTIHVGDSHGSSSKAGINPENITDVAV